MFQFKQAKSLFRIVAMVAAFSSLGVAQSVPDEFVTEFFSRAAAEDTVGFYDIATVVESSYTIQFENNPDDREYLELIMNGEMACIDEIFSHYPNGRDTRFDRWSINRFFDDLDQQCPNTVLAHEAYSAKERAFIGEMFSYVDQDGNNVLENEEMLQAMKRYYSMAMDDTDEGGRDKIAQWRDSDLECTGNILLERGPITYDNASEFLQKIAWACPQSVLNFNRHEEHDRHEDTKSPASNTTDKWINDMFDHVDTDRDEAITIGELIQALGSFYDNQMGEANGEEYDALAEQRSYEIRCISDMWQQSNMTVIDRNNAHDFLSSVTVFCPRSILNFESHHEDQQSTDPLSSMIRGMFDFVDLNRDDVIDMGELYSGIIRVYQYALDSIMTDATLTDDQREMAAYGINSTRNEDVNCVMKTMEMENITYVTPHTAATFLYQITNACPQSIVSISTRADNSQNNSEGPHSLSNFGSMVFARGDMNGDGVIDENELYQILYGFHQELIDRVYSMRENDIRCISMIVEQAKSMGYQVITRDIMDDFLQAVRNMCPQSALNADNHDYIQEGPASYEGPTGQSEEEMMQLVMKAIFTEVDYNRNGTVEGDELLGGLYGQYQERINEVYNEASYSDDERDSIIREFEMRRTRDIDCVTELLSNFDQEGYCPLSFDYFQYFMKVIVDMCPFSYLNIAAHH